MIHSLFKRGSPREILSPYYWPCPPISSLPLHPGEPAGLQGKISPFFHSPSMPVASPFLGISASGGSSLVSRWNRGFSETVVAIEETDTVTASCNLPSGGDSVLFQGLSCCLQEVRRTGHFPRKVGQKLPQRGLFGLQMLRTLWGGLLMWTIPIWESLLLLKDCYWWECDIPARS